jgi:hypothetical protein
MINAYKILVKKAEGTTWIGLVVERKMISKLVL